MGTDAGPHAALVADAIARWARLWRVPTLRSAVSIAFSRRMRSTLGRATPATGRVVLNAALLDGTESKLLEVLCHELAHVAAHRRYGATVRPHGAEWAAFVRQAGYAAVTRVEGQSSRLTPTAPAAGRYPVVHMCPVCHTRRFARRAVPRWRCAECVAAGLGGELTVIRTTE